MEVHHHPIAIGSHHGKKKWTEYFWEFLMLFLAVTLGFFVENQREHYVEHQRATEYAQQMYDDLKEDTFLYNKLVGWIDEHLKSFDTVNMLFGQTPPVSNKRLISALLPMRTTYPFHPKTTTFNQMKSSGTLRYFRNKEISKRVIEYYDVFHAHLRVAFDYADKFFTTDVQSFMLNHFDYNESAYFGDTLKVDNPTYLDRSPKTDMLLRNRMILYCSILKYIVDTPIRALQKRVIILMEQLKKEYHLD